MHANRLMPNVYRKKLLAFTIALTPDPDAFPVKKIYEAPVTAL